jgi:hypothetical protein
MKPNEASSAQIEVLIGLYGPEIQKLINSTRRTLRAAFPECATRLAAARAWFEPSRVFLHASHTLRRTFWPSGKPCSFCWALGVDPEWNICVTGFSSGDRSPNIASAVRIQARAA